MVTARASGHWLVLIDDGGACTAVADPGPGSLSPIPLLGRPRVPGSRRSANADDLIELGHLAGEGAGKVPV